MDVLKEGWIRKRAVSAPTALKNWKRRFITVRASGIEWRAGPREMATGSLPLTSSTLVSMDGTRRITVTHAAPTPRVLVLEMEEEDACAWFDAISAAVNASNVGAGAASSNQ